MSPGVRFSRHGWVLLLLAALGFVAWRYITGMRRAQFVSQIPDWSVADPLPDASSLTGYAHGQRRLIVPHHNNVSFDWIAHTQQMTARDEWRVRRIDYENAPAGRAVHAASPYRWWLGALAWVDRQISGRSRGAAVEHAALFADPILHGVLVLGTTLGVACWLGPVPAAVLAIGLVTLFPFGAGFVAGAPHQLGLELAAALWSVLPLLVGIRGVPDPARSSGGNGHVPGARAARRWFFLAGLAGGIGLWLNVESQLPVLVGVTAGALFGTWRQRRPAAARSIAIAALPWRAWALGGTSMSLLGYLVEYAPWHFGFQLQVNHPLYALAWLGTAEIAVRLEPIRRNGNRRWTRRDGIIAITAIVAVAAVPAAMILHGRGFVFFNDPHATQLGILHPIVANNLWAWIARDGVTLELVATLLPTAMAVPAIAVLASKNTPPASCVLLAVAIGPATAGIAIACMRLHAWSLADASLLVVLAACWSCPSASNPPRTHRRLWIGGPVVALLPGMFAIAPKTEGTRSESLPEVDVISLIERDLAHWLAQRVGPTGTVVLAPPDITAGLNFYGGLRGLGTMSWENVDGFRAAVRISAATASSEAQVLMEGRGCKHIVMPSWDTFLDRYARMGTSFPDKSLIAALHQLIPPLWLRPVPYHIPEIAGFPETFIAVFEVVDDPDPALHASRLADYFIEMEMADRITVVVPRLKQFPSDLGARVALARIAHARGESDEFVAALAEITRLLDTTAERALAWDRRVALAVVLAEGRRFDLARTQIDRCLLELDEVGLRSLTTGRLFHLHRLLHGFNRRIEDPKLRQLAHDLLPPSLASEFVR